MVLKAQFRGVFLCNMFVQQIFFLTVHVISGCSPREVVSQMQIPPFLTVTDLAVSAKDPPTSTAGFESPNVSPAGSRIMCAAQRKKM